MLRIGKRSYQTVLEFFKATSPYVKAVVPTWQLDAHQGLCWNPSGPPTSRVILYQDNPGKFIEASGAVLPCPGSVGFMDGLSDLQD